MDQALWMSVAGRGDGRPPNELWDAVVAEDWSSVRREWDRWMRAQLREMDRPAGTGVGCKDVDEMTVDG